MLLFLLFLPNKKYIMPTDNYGEVEIIPDILADRGKRLVNFIIDFIACFIITIATGSLGNWLYDTYGFNGLAIGNLASIEEHPFRFNLLQFFISIIYYGLFESLTMRSPGKFLTGTKVVMRNGAKPDETAIFIRTLIRRIPFEFVTFFGPYAIGWHDMFSKTLVVDVYKYERALSGKKTPDPNNDTII